MIHLTKPIVSVSWLKEHLQAENLVILDATIGKCSPEDFFNNQEKQIPNTRFFDLKQAFSDSSAPFPSTFPSETQFTKEAQVLGINKNSAIVVYDDKGIYSSARAWWLFKAMGHSNVAVLNGGFPEWLKSNYPVEERHTSDAKAGNFIAKYQPQYMKYFEDVKEMSAKKENVIIDARSKERFLSLVDEPRKGLRRGHIPNSINLPYEDLMDGYTLKDESELKEIFETLVKKKDGITFSCGSGLTACILALGAEISGYKNLSVYDGSWTEWGSLVRE